MKTLRTRAGLIALILGAAYSLSSPSVPADGLTLRLPAPPLPRIVLPLPPPPPMVWLPNLNVYVAHRSQRPIFFREGRYYVRDHDRWLAAPDYDGPWVQIDIDRLPRSLRVYRDRDWDRYEHEADEHYRDRGDDAPVPFYPAHYDNERDRGWDQRREDGEYRRDDRGEDRHDEYRRHSDDGGGDDD